MEKTLFVDNQLLCFLTRRRSRPKNAVPKAPKAPKAPKRLFTINFKNRSKTLLTRGPKHLPKHSQSGSNIHAKVLPKHLSARNTDKIVQAIFVCLYFAIWGFPGL
jgi:hypothetical protein